MTDDKHLLVVFPTVFEPSGILRRRIRRVQFCRVEDISGGSQNKVVEACKKEDDFLEVLTRTAPVAVTVTRDLGENVDIDSVKKRKYRPIGVVRALSYIADLTQLVELRVVGVKLPEKDCHSMKFGNLQNLQLLALDAVGLGTLHPSVGMLRSLHTLSLQHNMLYDLPLTVRFLTQLDTLNITGNFFPILPGAIFHLSSLQNLIGVEACPLQLETDWTNTSQGFWIAPPNCPSDASCRQPANLDSPVHSVVGLDHKEAGLSHDCTDRLAQMAATHELCDNCFLPIFKLTPQQETTGHILKVLIPEFCGIRNVPFRFMACSEECKGKVNYKIQRIVEAQRHKLQLLEQTGLRLARHLCKVECYDIWEMRRRSRLGRGVDMNLRADPAELVKNPDWALVDTELIAQVLGIEAVPVVTMESPV